MRETTVKRCKAMATEYGCVLQEAINSAGLFILTDRDLTLRAEDRDPTKLAKIAQEWARGIRRPEHKYDHNETNGEDDTNPIIWC